MCFAYIQKVLCLFEWKALWIIIGNDIQSDLRELEAEYCNFVSCLRSYILYVFALLDILREISQSHIWLLWIVMVVLS